MKSLKMKSLLIMSIALGLMFMSCEKSSVNKLENNIEATWKLNGSEFLFSEGVMYDGPTADITDVETNYIIKSDSILLFYDENGTGEPQGPISQNDRYGLEFVDNNQTMWWTKNGQVTHEFIKVE